MTATLAHLLVALGLALARGPRIALLQFQIWETAHYLDDCAADGLIHSLHAEEWAKRLRDMRAQLAQLQAPALPQPRMPRARPWST